MNPLTSFGANRYSGPSCSNPWIFWTLEGPRNNEGLTADETFVTRAPVSMIRSATAYEVSAGFQQRRVLREEQGEALATWEDEGGVARSSVPGFGISVVAS